MSAEVVLVGVFVGGASRRMGGQAKGLLTSPDGRPLVVRALAIARELGLPAVLVGRRAEYAHLGAQVLDDGPRDGAPLEAPQGPLGGLVALLEHASLAHRAGPVVALACDLPAFTPELLGRLLHHAPGAAAVAPREQGHASDGEPRAIWSPLFARYDPAQVLPTARARFAEGKLSLQPLLDACGAVELPLRDAERAQLRDWDTPADLKDQRSR